MQRDAGTWATLQDAQHKPEHSDLIHFPASMQRIAMLTGKIDEHTQHTATQCYTF
jgi:hypothetical protein